MSPSIWSHLKKDFQRRTNHDETLNTGWYTTLNIVLSSCFKHRSPLSTYRLWASQVLMSSLWVRQMHLRCDPPWSLININSMCYLYEFYCLCLDEVVNMSICYLLPDRLGVDSICLDSSCGFHLTPRRLQIHTCASLHAAWDLLLRDYRKPAWSAIHGWIHRYASITRRYVDMSSSP